MFSFKKIVNLLKKLFWMRKMSLVMYFDNDKKRIFLETIKNNLMIIEHLLEEIMQE